MLAVPLTASDATTLQQLQSQQTQAQAQLATTKTQYAQAQSAINATVSQINQLNSILAHDRARVASLGQQVAATRVELTTIQKQIVKIKAHLKYEAGLLSSQVRLMEEHGSIGYLDVVLGARSFSDFISRLYILGQISAMAGHLVHQIQAEAALEKAKEAQVTQQEQHLVVLQNQAQAAANQVAAVIGQRHALMGNLKSQQANELAIERSLNSKLASIAKQILYLLSQFNGGYLTLHQLYTALYPLVQPVAAQFGLSPALVIAVITEESGGNQKAVSPTGAIGLMQVEPYTAKDWGYTTADLQNAQDNVLIGCRILSSLLVTYGGTASVSLGEAMPAGNATSPLSDALAAYNAGQGNVSAYGLQGLYNQHWGVHRYVTNIESLFVQYSGWAP